MKREHLVIAAVVIVCAIAFFATRHAAMSVRRDIDSAMAEGSTTIRGAWPHGLIGFDLAMTRGGREAQSVWRDRAKGEFSFFIDTYPPHKE